MPKDKSALRSSGQFRSTIRIFETLELGAPLVHVLAPRELEAAGWVSEGLSNRDIGIIMGLTENTVKKYLMRIFERTGCENRVVLAIRFAREHTGYSVAAAMILRRHVMLTNNRCEQ